LIIAILFEQFVKRRPAGASRLHSQFEPQRCEQLANFGKAQLSGAAVFQQVDHCSADARPSCEVGLTQSQTLPAFGDLMANGYEIHMPNILGIQPHFKRFA
jgi:hypothetical protein